MYAPTLTDRVDGSLPLRRRQRLARALASGLASLDVAGLDHVPADGPVIFAINHRSALDGLLVFGLVTRPANFLVKMEAFTPTLAPVLRGAGQIPITRHRVDRGAIRLCVQILRSGGVVGIFPEGRRGDGLVGSAKPGVGYLALRSGAVVVPTACHGTERMSQRRSARRPAARLVFGAPIAVERHPDDRPLNRRVVAASTEKIRAALAELVATTGEGAVAA